MKDTSNCFSRKECKCLAQFLNFALATVYNYLTSKHPDSLPPPVSPPPPFGVAFPHATSDWLHHHGDVLTCSNTIVIDLGIAIPQKLVVELKIQDLKNQEATVTGFVYPKKVVKAAKATGKKS
ncbi:Hypothetical predicted protein [Olea europaea subsp. europaea]|uniref:Uncharacterized protein n=1 Tax=Olea europaea subsp. europaea TaxID=158383 RepID=A0A8S0QKZ3_OLEEU|nr:Hypothetical predicted protein [Olea europaea subsp. europaea]